MCKKQSTATLTLPNGKRIRIDPCMKNIVYRLNQLFSHVPFNHIPVRSIQRNIQTVACCCGHGIYPPSLIIKQEINKGKYKVVKLEELFSGKVLYTKNRHYVKDDKGYYYIPKVIEAMENKTRYTR